MVEPTGYVHALMSVLRALGSPIFRAVKKVRAMAKAGANPGKFQPVDQQLSEASHRSLTASSEDGRGLKGLPAVVLAKMARAEVLRTPNALEWMRLREVKADLGIAADALFVGHDVPDEVRRRLVDSFMRLASATTAEAEPVVAAACESLAVARRAEVRDPALGAMILSVHQREGATLERIEHWIASLTTADGPAAPLELNEAETESWRESFVAASEDLLHWPTTFKDGSRIEQPELQVLLEVVASTDRHAAALLGGPGTGKSALLAQLGKRVQDMPDTSLLAIKGDLLDSDITTEEDLQRAMNLPGLPSRMVDALARNGRVVVLLDQLDALAGHLDLKTGRLSVLLNLVKACSSIENVTVIVSCRTFEFSHDVRLSRIEAEGVELELPTWPDVLAVLERHGVHAEAWAKDVQDVVRVPQQLKTFLDLHSEGGTEPFDSYTRMLDQLWDRRVTDAPGGGAMATTAYQAAEAMASREALWIAKARFDDHPAELQALVSAGILAEARGSIGFAHQTVFEHVLARGFACVEGSLSKYVLAKKESLFVRPKVWAAMTYLREVEPDTYAAEVRAIWEAADLPNHLRFLLVEFLGSQLHPTDAEEALLRQAWAQPRLAPLVLKAVRGSAGWFARLADSLIRQSMLDGRLRDLCTPLLESPRFSRRLQL